MIFKDRIEAGKILGERLVSWEGNKEVIVLGIPRGGVVVAAEVAKILKAPLDTIIVRKLGVPFHPELAFGAVDVHGNVVLDKDIVSRLKLSEEAINEVREREQREAERREALFRRGKGNIDLKEKIVILVDDGIATGATTEAAINYIREINPSKLILACPVAPPDTVDKLRPLVDDLIVLQTPLDFMAVGQFYSDFPQTSDGEVINLLSENN